MNLDALVRKLIKESGGAGAWRGVVTGTSGNLVSVEHGVETVTCARLASYSSPSPGDEVVVSNIGGGYIVLGKVLR